MDSQKKERAGRRSCCAATRTASRPGPQDRGAPHLMAAAVELEELRSQYERTRLLTRLRHDMRPASSDELGNCETSLIQDRIDRLGELHPEADYLTLQFLTLDILGEKRGPFETVDGMMARYESELIAAHARLAGPREKSENAKRTEPNPGENTEPGSYNRTIH